MKKMVLTLSLILVIALVGCVQEESIGLLVPGNFKVVDDIVSFNEVDNATGYRIEVLNQETLKVKKYLVDNNQDLKGLNFEPGNYLIKIQAISNKANYKDSEFSGEIMYQVEDDSLVSLIEGILLTDNTKVKMFGRYFYNEREKQQYFYFTASGFEVKFIGTKLIMNLVTGINSSEKVPYVVVFIDGEEDPTKGETHALDNGINEIIIDGLSEDIHTIKVLKRSESTDSKTSIKSLETDGYFIENEPYKERKIEVIAASSSAGYGNLISNGVGDKTTANSDGLRSFATLTAKYLDAEINIFSASGWAVKKSPWHGNSNIPNKYDYVDVESSIRWSFNNYVPDIYVVNLGTNDWSYINTLSNSSERQEALENFINAYVDFIVKLHNLNKDASIIIVYGLMNETNIFEATNDVYQVIKDDYSEIDIHILQLPKANLSDGMGAGSHPGLVTHEKAALLLSSKIAEIKNWSID
ncbi:MAG: hypothetical protein PHY22_02500 [Acholeplasmataceae bacterium]|nr:hypothetical protein [Acholeplasmataceae bacterium]